MKRITKFGATCLLVLSGLALLTACSASASATTAPHPTAIATATPHTKTLSWRQITLPTGVNFASESNAGFAVSPVNGQVAWICAPKDATTTTFQLWRTQDAGQTWSQRGALTPNPQSPITLCSFGMNQTSTDGVAVRFGWGAGADGTSRTRSYYSPDSGAHWNALTGDVNIGPVASNGQTTYAILYDTTTPNAIANLVSSVNNFASWRTLRPSGVPTHVDAVNFWASPTNKDMIVQYQSSLTFPNQEAFRSTTDGASWSLVAPPAGQSSFQISFAHWRAADHSWLLCGGANNAVGCTTNLGQTWSALPSLNSSYTCAACGKTQTLRVNIACYPTWASEAAIFAVCPSLDTTPSSGTIEPTIDVVYQLPMGAVAWQAIGVAPSFAFWATQTGQLWAFDSIENVSILDQLP